MTPRLLLVLLCVIAGAAALGREIWLTRNDEE
jgi:hypothetical protein